MARIYDPGRVQRSADYAALVAALDVHRRIPGVDHNRRLLLDRILRARIPDEFAKLGLLRALAADGVPDAAEAPPVDLRSLPPAKRQAITDRLVEILPAMRGLDEPEASQAIEDLESRLGRGLQVPLVRSGSRAAVRVGEGFVQLAVLACDWCRFDREKARKEIWDGPFAGAARKDAGGEDAAGALLKNALDVAFDEAVDTGGAAGAPVRRPIEPPRDLVGEELAGPLVDSVIDLLARATPEQWPLEHDHMVLLNASVLLGASKQVEARWDRYLAAVSTRFARPAEALAGVVLAQVRGAGDPAGERRSGAPLAGNRRHASVGTPAARGLRSGRRGAAAVGAPFRGSCRGRTRAGGHRGAGRRRTRGPCPRRGALFCAGRACCRTISSCVGDTSPDGCRAGGGNFRRFFGPVLEEYGLDADALEIEEEA